MRSDKYPTGSRPAVGPPGSSPDAGISEQATQVADVGLVDPRGELRKEVTVVTLVSRQHVMATAGGSHPSNPSSGVFSFPDDATLTVSADTLREEKAKLDAKRFGAGPASGPQPAMRPASSAVTGSMDKTERVDRSQGPRAVVEPSGARAAAPDETPMTRGMRADTGASRLDDNTRMRRRLILASAAVGVLLALGIVAVVEIFDEKPHGVVVAVKAPDPGEPIEPVVPIKDPAITPVVVPVASTVKVTLRSSIAGAVVVVGDQRGPSPFTLQARPGDVLAVRIEAPGTRDDAESITVPADQQTDYAVDVVARFKPVRVEARVEPTTAEILVDGEVLGKDTTVEANTAVVVDVSAPGFVPVRQELKAAPGAPLVVKVKLQPGFSGTPAPDDKAAPKRPVVRGTGTLKLKTTPYWGQVTIDGKTYEDNTPLSVQLAAGSHDVVVSHPPKNLVRKFKVVVKANDTVTRTITFD